MRIDGLRRKIQMTERRRLAFAGEIPVSLREWISFLIMPHDVPSQAPDYLRIMLRVDKPIPLKKWKLPNPP